ncbi:MAG: hypothetical protein H7Y17_00880 [Chlorobia bacterium]|nr:hypothetical protein [Fimbriimonadaceae bacterium]
MICLLYILTGTAFYWLSYQSAAHVDDNSTTHPIAPQAEIVCLFPEIPNLQAA